MAFGKCSIAKQNDSIGMFVEIIVDVQTAARDAGVEIKPESNHFSSPRDLQIACECGIHYAYEQMFRSIQKGIVVKVLRLNWQPVDTKTIPVVYASAMAVWDALGYKAERTAKWHKEDFSFTFFKD